MNVDQYLKRINYNGEREPTLGVLRSLCWHHVCHVPYDTIGLQSGPRKILNFEVLFENIVVKKRGGFCYETCGLFYWLLKQLGYNVIIIKAQEFDKRTGKYGLEYGHLANLVTFDNNDRWIADVTVLTDPIRLDTIQVQVLNCGIRRIIPCVDKHDFYQLQKCTPKIIEQKDGEEISRENVEDCNIDPDKIKWEFKYRFDLTPCNLSDFQASLDYHSTSKASEYAHNSFCVLHYKGGYMCLWGNTLIEKTFINLKTELLKRTKVENTEKVRKLLEDKFGVKVETDLDLMERDVERIKGN